MKLKKITTLVVVFAMMLSLAATMTITVSAKPAAATAWFEFDKATGGWIVNDISRGANSKGEFTGDMNYGHRVQIIPNGIDENDVDAMPDPNGYEVLLRLPGLKPGKTEDDEDGEWSFQDIAKVSVDFEIEWDKWPAEDRTDFEIITQTNIPGDDFVQHKAGGNIGEILTNAGIIEENDPEGREPTDISEYPSPVTMNAAPKMYEPESKFDPATYADFFIVMVTNWTKCPVIAKVTLLDHNNNIIRLICPDCKKEQCVCNCPDCGKEMSKCECNPCEQCGKFRYLCDCCKACGKKKEDCTCEVVAPPPPPPPTTEPKTPAEATGKKYKLLTPFEEWKGTGTATVKIDAAFSAFKKVVLKKEGSPDKDVDKANYEAKEGSTIITFKEAYLSSLANGTYSFVAIFGDKDYAEIPLTISKSGGEAITKSDVTGAAPAAASTTKKNSDTNPKTGVTIAFIPILIAAGASVVAGRRRK
ncbi:MAG: hypothetical protein FWF94_02760 [Oscillospiraceae bacterium]|nr:hypothetical protein [Oscillospiraceae bacterium]